jgi:hypothetical protein
VSANLPNAPIRLGSVLELSGLVPPSIGFGQERVRIRTGEYALEHASRCSLALPSSRLDPGGRTSFYSCGVETPTFLLHKHVAVSAAFAAFLTAYPEIEGIIMLR